MEVTRDPLKKQTFFSRIHNVSTVESLFLYIKWTWLSQKKVDMAHKMQCDEPNICSSSAERIDWVKQKWFKWNWALTVIFTN